MQIPHQTTQRTLRAHSKNTRIGQMAMNGHIKRATRKQEASEIGGTGPAQRAEAWGPEIAPPAGEKMIKDTEEMVRFPNWMNVTSIASGLGNLTTAEESNEGNCGD